MTRKPTPKHLVIRPLAHEDLEAVRRFTDTSIGKNYFSLSDLEDAFEKSQDNGVMCSFVLVDDKNTLHGIRIAYAPGKWTRGKSRHLRPDLWTVERDEAGYFQSLFLSEEARGGGWGPKLSQTSVDALKKLKARAIVTHAWKESPDNSSLRYLTKFGFKEVATHPHYWKDVDYVCTLDGKPCLCTAIEMIRYL